MKTEGWQCSYEVDHMLVMCKDYGKVVMTILYRMRVSIRLVIKTKLIVFAIYTIYYVHVFWEVHYTLSG